MQVAELALGVLPKMALMVVELFAQGTITFDNNDDGRTC
jgi:hypothetical protein